VDFCKNVTNITDITNITNITSILPSFAQISVVLEKLQGKPKTFDTPS